MHKEQFKIVLEEYKINSDERKDTEKTTALSKAFKADVRLQLMSDFFF